jgi:hypothetical protein
MTKPKLTPWFNGSVKPVRPGVYLATILMSGKLDDSRGLYRYWNGKHWCKPSDTPTEAAHPSMQRRAFFRITYWRGLARPAASSSEGKGVGNGE